MVSGMDTSRRRFLLGATATLIAAPAIIRVASSLMPISSKIIVPLTLVYSSPLYKHPSSLTWVPEETTIIRFNAGEKPIRQDAIVLLHRVSPFVLSA